MRFALIAYSYADDAPAQALTEDLRQRGIDVWLADDANLGDWKRQRTAQILNRCTAYICITSPAAADSAWVQSTIEAPHYHCELFITVKAETIQQNMDQWRNSVGEKTNLVAQDFYDLLVKAHLTHRRRGRLLTSRNFEIERVRQALWPATRHMLLPAVLLLLLVCFMVHVCLLLVPAQVYPISSPDGECTQLGFPNLSVNGNPATTKFNNTDNPEVRTDGFGTSRPIVRVYGGLGKTEDKLLAEKEAKFGESIWSGENFLSNRPLVIEVTCDGFCYYWVTLNGDSGCPIVG